MKFGIFAGLYLEPVVVVYYYSFLRCTKHVPKTVSMIMCVGAYLRIASSKKRLPCKICIRQEQTEAFDG